MSLLNTAAAQNIFGIHEILKDPEIKFGKVGLKSIVQDYIFIHISQSSALNEDEKQKIFQNVKKSKIIIIDQNDKFNKETNQQYLIICFEKTLIILDHSSTFLQDILSTNFNLSVCFLSNTNTIIQEKYEIKNKEIKPDSDFLDEIRNLSLELLKTTQKISKFWQFFVRCLSGYLIKKSYLRHNKNRIENFISNLEQEKIMEEINENDYVELRNVGFGSTFLCKLIFLIKSEELCVIKKPNIIDPENTKLIQREINNYINFKHPFLPDFYGKVKDNDFFIIEFINGQTLKNIDMIELTNNDVLSIIFQMMMIIKFFYENELIYRDLKPNNLIIDENKIVTLIDLDRLIHKNDDDDEPMTKDLNSYFSAPEVNQKGIYSYESDIYSLGKMIQYVMKSKFNQISIQQLKI